MNFGSLQHVQAATINGQHRAPPQSGALHHPGRQSGALHYLAGFHFPRRVRLQGLVTLLAAWSRHNRAGLISCRQRSWDSPFEAFSSAGVVTRFRACRTRLPFLPSVSHAARGGGPARQAAASGLSPPIGVPRGRRAMNPQAAGCFRGLFSSRVNQCRSWPSVPGRLSRASRADPRPSRPPAPQSISDPHLAATRRAAERRRPAATLIEFSRLFRSATFGQPPRRAMGSPAHRVVHRCRLPVLFDGYDSLP